MVEVPVKSENTQTTHAPTNNYVEPSTIAKKTTSELVDFPDGTTNSNYDKPCHS